MAILKYIGRRLLVLIPVLLGISLAAFLLGRIAPGDPVDDALFRIGIEFPTEEDRADMRAELGLDRPLPVPVVFNCGGYERVETLRLLEGKVQIWLPDLKYGLEEPARRYSHAPDYFPVATEAIREMFRQVGPCRMEDGLLRQGVVIRHLVLPGQLESTRRVIDWVARTFRPGEVLFSLMSQYTPQPGAEGPLRRHVTAAEYRAAAEYMENCGIVDGFVQERTSAREEYTPAFDLTGV